MELILVRHGESVWNKEGKVQGSQNPVLSKKGKQQAELLARRFEDIINNIEVIYSSPLVRAYETAKIITRYNENIPIYTHDALREIELGEWEEKTIEKIKKQYPGMLEKWYSEPLSVKVPGGETILEFKHRVTDVLDNIVKKHYHQNKVLVVTHGGVISIYIAYLLEMNLNKIWSIMVKNTAVNIINFYNHMFTITLFNDTYHLQEEMITW
jgi:broad specificity phosphatase PhoE